jgi:hypothetical protein
MVNGKIAVVLKSVRENKLFFHFYYVLGLCVGTRLSV